MGHETKAEIEDIYRPRPIQMAHLNFRDLIEEIRRVKPGDRSEIDRYCQIVVTDLEKAHAVFYQYVVEPTQER